MLPADIAVVVEARVECRNGVKPGVFTSRIDPLLERDVFV
jgi:hypothetical protein